MLKIYSFLEWKEVRAGIKCKCEAQPSQVCDPSKTDTYCVFHYGEYVYDALDDKLKPEGVNKRGKEKEVERKEKGEIRGD